jgi:hypothetical protein
MENFGDRLKQFHTRYDKRAIHILSFLVQFNNLPVLLSRIDSLIDDLKRFFYDSFSINS